MIVSTFINTYLPVHICPGYILSNNGTEFKNNLTDQVLKQLGVERIFSTPYHPWSNGKLEVFHKYLNPTLKKLCEKDSSNWHQYLNWVLASYSVMPNLATAEMPFFLVYGRDSNVSLAQPLEPMQWFRRSIFQNTKHWGPQTHISHCQEDVGQESFQNITKDHG